MLRTFVVTAELTAQPEATEAEVSDIVKTYIHELRMAEGIRRVDQKVRVFIGTESIKDEQGREVMTPWPKEETYESERLTSGKICSKDATNTQKGGSHA